MRALPQHPLQIQCASRISGSSLELPRANSPQRVAPRATLLPSEPLGVDTRTPPRPRRPTSKAIRRLARASRDETAPDVSVQSWCFAMQRCPNAIVTKPLPSNPPPTETRDQRQPGEASCEFLPDPFLTSRDPEPLASGCGGHHRRPVPAFTSLWSPTLARRALDPMSTVPRLQPLPPGVACPLPLGYDTMAPQARRSPALRDAHAPPSEPSGCGP